MEEIIVIDWTYVIVAVISAALPSVLLLRKNKTEIAEISTRVYERVIVQLEKEIKDITEKHRDEIEQMTERHNQERAAWKKERAAWVEERATLERTIQVETELRMKLEKKVEELLKKVKVLEQKTGPLPDRMK